MNIAILKEQIISESIKINKDIMQSILAQCETSEITYLANELRKHYSGTDFDTCSIINARSGRCSEDCKWCSQSKFFNTNVDIYPLISPHEALSMAQHNASKGVRRFSLVTSGRKVSMAEMPKVREIYDTLAQNVKIELCASMGLLNREEMKALWSAGVRRYHCNIETSPSFFATLCTTHTMQDKLDTIHYAQELGMDICSGGIIGMGETMGDRIDMALLLRDENIGSIPINVLNPIKGTPLASSEPMTKDELIRSFAMFRIINPKARIRFAGGRKLFSDVQEQLLTSGADAAIVGDMLTTVGSSIDEDMQMFKEYGFTI